VILITKVDPFTGKTNQRLIDITREQLEQYEKGGKCIQDAFPHLTPDEREFIMTGITPDSWNAAFNKT